MWKFVGSCGHTVEGFIQQVDEHIYSVHQAGEQFQWQMYSLATDQLADTFLWPLG